MHIWLSFVLTLMYEQQPVQGSRPLKIGYCLFFNMITSNILFILHWDAILWNNGFESPKIIYDLKEKTKKPRAPEKILCIG